MNVRDPGMVDRASPHHRLRIDRRIRGSVRWRAEHGGRFAPDGVEAPSQPDLGQEGAAGRWVLHIGTSATRFVVHLQHAIPRQKGARVSRSV